MRHVALAERQQVSGTGAPELKAHLDRLYGRYGSEYLETDPISFPRSYVTKRDREVVALVTSALCYGRVPQIKASVAKLMTAMGESPADFVDDFDPERGMRALKGFVHRFNDAADVGLLLHFIRQMRSRSGSIEGFFAEGYAAGQEDIGPALSSFVRRTLALDCAAWYRGGRLPASAGVRFLLPSPEDGSTCKRLNLFLRWVVRADDGVDLGLWRSVSPARLVIPLDTHVSRIAANIGLTSRRTVDWKMALEVTRRLRELDPLDPVKYDFALCRMGILDACPRRRDPIKCEGCDLKPICTLS